MEAKLEHGIITAGHGTILVTADEAHISAFVSVRCPDRSDAVQRASEESARLSAALDRVGYDRLTTGGLTVTAERKRKVGALYTEGPVVAYWARQAFGIIDRNVDRIRALAGLLAGWKSPEGVAVEVQGVTWSLSPEGRSAAAGDAYSAAYRDAHRRASMLVITAGMTLSKGG